MKDDTELYRQLNRPQIPDELENKILANWQDQKSGKRAKKTSRYLVTAVSVFAFAIGSVLVYRQFISNDLVQVAINDIRKDDSHHVGITIPVELLVKQAKIHLPPASMPIEMTKLCHLNSDKTMHIKVAGKKHGAVHLFIKAGNFDASFRESGHYVPSMPWKLIKPRKDISVLVVYTEDMNPASVDELIKAMFYA